MATRAARLSGVADGRVGRPGGRGYRWGQPDPRIGCWFVAVFGSRRVAPWSSSGTIRPASGRERRLATRSSLTRRRDDRSISQDGRRLGRPLRTRSVAGSRPASKSSGRCCRRPRRTCHDYGGQFCRASSRSTSGGAMSLSWTCRQTTCLPTAANHLQSPSSAAEELLGNGTPTQVDTGRGDRRGGMMWSAGRAADRGCSCRARRKACCGGAIRVRMTSRSRRTDLG